MTEQETVQIITLIVMSYPSNEKLKDETTLKGMVSVWKVIFKDDDARLVETAVQKHIVSNKWPPSIAEVREQMVNITRPDIIPPDIAWTAVENLLYTHGEYGCPNLDELPKSVANVVRTIGWSRLYNLHCGRMRGNPDGMDRVAFMELYKPIYAREREQAMMPQRLRTVLERKKEEVAGNTMMKFEALQQQRIYKEKFDFFYGENCYLRTEDVKQIEGN